MINEPGTWGKSRSWENAYKYLYVRKGFGMRLRKPYVAKLNQVKIARKGETAVIEYKDKTVSAVNLHIGPELERMSDQEVLDIHNDIIRVQTQMAAQYVHVAVEIPQGSPQIVYSKECDQWVPRGDVLRCEISDGGFDGDAMVIIDDRELSLREFGRLLVTHAGWGMRITFVPDDRLAEEPDIEVREPPEK